MFYFRVLLTKNFAVLGIAQHNKNIDISKVERYLETFHPATLGSGHIIL